jgi:hypothetical protein
MLVLGLNGAVYVTVRLHNLSPARQPLGHLQRSRTPTPHVHERNTHPKTEFSRSGREADTVLEIA